MHRLTYDEVDRIRSTPGLALLLFITDRCPVGCAHCSVDSRSDSPSIANFALFDEILAGICAQPGLSLVGISGGEPFVERRGLCMAVDRLEAAGKDIAIYTSGIWANAKIPAWIRGVIGRASCIFLSTDAFHAGTVDDARFVRAARTIHQLGTWIIVQVLNIPQMVQRAEGLLRQAFGDDYSASAEIHLLTPLPYGRGQQVFALGPRRRGESFGPCAILASPVVRYDGVISACCNEPVIMGKGPERLRGRCASTSQVTDTLASLSNDPLLNIMRDVGAGVLTQHPRFADLGQRHFSRICELCWTMQQRALPRGDESDRLLTAMAALGSRRYGA